jgi:hypothetical protein
MAFPELVQRLDAHVQTACLEEMDPARLKSLLVVAMYIYNRPRRVVDYWKLQLYSRLPDEMKGKNILYVPEGGGPAMLYIDVFKFREVVVKNTPREVMPRFSKPLDPRCEAIMRAYIKAWKITDMASVNQDDDTQYYVFPTVDNTMYEDGSGFGSLVQKAFHDVYRVDGVRTNKVRHVYMQFIQENHTKFSHADYEEIVTDIGEMPRTTTAVTYSHQDPRYAGMSSRDIELLLCSRPRRQLDEVEEADLCAPVAGAEQHDAKISRRVFWGCLALGCYVTYTVWSVKSYWAAVW